MTDQSTDSERSCRWPAEPSVHVRKAWISWLSLASLGMWMASLTPIQVLLPIQLQNIDKAHKLEALAIVSGVGAVASVLATPLAGALSDRTTYAFSFFGLNGRRHRWTLIMALLGAISMLVLAHQKSVAGVALHCGCCSALSRTASTPALARRFLITCRCDSGRRWLSWVGMPQALGLVVGTVLVVLVLASNVISGYYVMAALFFVLVIPFVFLTPDHPLDPAEHVDAVHLEENDPGARTGSARRKYPDFAWAWITRFLASLAIATR